MPPHDTDQPILSRLQRLGRLYTPESAALTGKWNPPAVRKVDALRSLTAQ